MSLDSRVVWRMGFLCAAAAILLAAGAIFLPSWVWSGSMTPLTVVGSALSGWLVGELLHASRPRTEATAKRAQGIQTAARWTRDPSSPLRHQLLKEELEDLRDAHALDRSPLALIPGLTSRASAGPDLKALLVDVITELAASPAPRDAEAGRLLLDYYVKRVGSHDVVMERLHLSRPTFYRRLQLGLDRVGERIDELSDFAARNRAEAAWAPRAGAVYAGAAVGS